MAYPIYDALVDLIVVILLLIVLFATIVSPAFLVLFGILLWGAYRHFVIKRRNGAIK